MSRSEVTEGQIREVARRIGEQPGVVQVWLFGSHATGTAGPDSDVDLLAIYEGEPDILGRMQELQRLFVPRSFGIDIMVMGRDEFIETGTVPGGIAYQTNRHGRVVYHGAS